MQTTSSSTENLLNSFPMFGHPGISALEYAGSVEASRSNRNTSETLESLKRKSTTSTQDENSTPPTTAGTEPSEPHSSPQAHVVRDLGCQQRQRGTFLNHTPRYYEMRSSPTLDMHRPSRASIENYSRPRTTYQSCSVASNRASGSRHDENHQFHPIEKRLTLNRGSPIELDATEKQPTSASEDYKSSTTDDRLPVSVHKDEDDAFQWQSSSLISQHGNERSGRGANRPARKLQEKKRQRRQTPFRLASPKLTISMRHAPLEPWVAKHRRERTNSTTDDMVLQSEIGAVKEMGTFGVIQRYFDSQTGGPVASPEILCNNCAPAPLNLALSTSSQSYPEETFREPVAIFPIDDLSHEAPPALPDRSPKRVTNPSFPFHHKPVLSVDSDFAIAADGEYSPYENKMEVLHVSKKRNQERIEVGEAAPAGLSKLGRMAPPILGHDALTASSHLGLNDLSYYLKNTGPSPEPTPITRQEKKIGLRIFKVRQRKTLAARVGSVEGSPQTARRDTPVPKCAKEVTTSSGTRHLKIIIPAESPPSTHAPSLSMSKARTKRRSKQISITFTEEMCNPLSSPRIEHMLSNARAPMPSGRSVSDPIIQTRTTKKLLRSFTIPVDHHPLVLSREESTRARKLRDLERVKRKPLPPNTQINQYPHPGVTSLPTPRWTPEIPSSPLSSCYQDRLSLPTSELEEDSYAEKMVRLQNRVVLLSRQNTELTEALAKIVGLELEEGDLTTEDVLRAYRERGSSIGS